MPTQIKTTKQAAEQSTENGAQADRSSSSSSSARRSTYQPIDQSINQGSERNFRSNPIQQELKQAGASINQQSGASLGQSVELIDQPTNRLTRGVDQLTGQPIPNQSKPNEQQARREEATNERASERASEKAGWVDTPCAQEHNTSNRGMKGWKASDKRWRRHGPRERTAD